MHNLRRKAHISLQEFREGRQSPTAGNMPYRPFMEGPADDNEDDELFKLGGKTRLISQKDSSKSPSPQIVTRSPHTHNPIVPLPLPDDSMHPSIMEYLSTFNYAPGSTQGGARQNGHMQSQPMFEPQTPLYDSRSPGVYVGSDGPGSMQFHPDAEIHAHSLRSAEAMQGALPSTSGTSSIHTLINHSPEQSPVHTHPSTSAGQQYFPQYFPVFDYGTADGQNVYSPIQLASPVNTLGASYDQTNGMTYNGSGRAYPQPQQGRRESLTPEASMHTTWMDFVTQQMNLTS